MVAETSKQAYASIYAKLGKKQETVYNALGDMGVGSNEQIADYLGWPINCVTGRMSELKKFNLVAVHGLTRGRSGHSAKTWCVRTPNDDKLMDIE